MKKFKNRILAVLLAVIMVVGLVSASTMTIFAAGDESPAVGDYLYFGTWGTGDSDTFPIKWRVLDADSTNMGANGGIYLVSEYLLGDAFAFDDSSNAWSGSNAQLWCQEFANAGVGASTYITDGWGLSSSEAAAVLTTSITDAAATVNTYNYAATSMSEKVFFMSAKETIDYLSYDNSGACDSTIAYKVAAGGTAGSAYHWWLRSPYATHSTYEGYVTSSGTVHSNIVTSTNCARPALNLNLESCVFASDISGAAGAGDEKLVFVPKEGESNAWRLATEEEKQSVALTGTVTISGAAAYGEILTAILSDSNNTGDLSYQWKRGNDEVGAGSTYTVAEADIGSTLTCTVTSSVQSGSVTSAATATVEKAAGPVAPTGLGSTAPTTTGGSDGTITGVDTTMEWDDNAEFSSPTTCTGDTITGLSAGDYYVRVAATNTASAGAPATVTVDAATVGDADNYTVSVSPTSETTVYAGDAVSVTVDIASSTANYVGTSFNLTWDSDLFEAPAELPENWYQREGYLRYVDENTSVSEDYTLTFTAKAQTEQKTATFTVNNIKITISAQDALDGKPDTELSAASSAVVTLALKNVTADTLGPDEDPVGETTEEQVGTIDATTAAIDYTTTVTYDGENHSFPVPTLEDAAAIAGGSTLALTYSDTVDGVYTAALPAAKTDAGTYTVYYKGTITGFAQEISGALTLKIDKKDISAANVTLDNTELTYTGQEQTVNVTSVVVDGLTVPVVDYTVSGNKQTAAGNYSASVEVTATNSNFTGTASEGWEIITSDEPLGTDGSNVTATPTDTLEYNGSAQNFIVTLSANAPADAVVTYSATLRGAYSETPLTGTDAGDYPGYYKVTSANWTEPITGNYISTISPKAINITVDAQTKLVGMADPKLTYSSFDASQLCGDDTEEGLGISLTRVAGETVGDYAITGTITDGNYTPNFSAANLTISALTLASDDITHDEDAAGSGETTTGGHNATDSTTDNLVFDFSTAVTYDGENHTFPVPTLANDTAIAQGAVLTLTYSSAKNGTYTVDLPAARTNAGTYTVYYKGIVTGFEQTISGTLTLNIAKKDITGATITLSDADGVFEYTGSLQTMGVISVEIDGITVPAADYQITGNRQTQAGNYMLTVAAYSDSVNFTGSQSVAWSITGGTGSATVTPANDIVYNGRQQSLSAAIKDIPDDAVITYSEEETGSFGSAVPTAKNAGTYTVYYQITSANWTEAFKGSYDVEIAPKAISITINAAEKYVGEDDPAFTYQTVSGLAAGDTEESLGISLTRAAGESAGSYAINGSVTNTNYNPTFVSANMTIKDATAGTDYFVEIVNSGNSTYGVDYATGWSLVLVYTDKGMKFNYDGTLMLDVTDSGYKYDKVTSYEHIYGYVVKGGATADKVSISAAGSSPTIVTYNTDINGLGLSIGDVVSALATRSLVDVNVNSSNMSAILKSDVNKDKTVDGLDVNLVKTDVVQYGD